MPRRGVQEVNAGAMADIAFLLLVFFIVTSTMDPENAVRQTLPKRVDVPVKPPPTRKRDILRIKTNRNNEIFVRGQFLNRDDMDVLAEKVREFYSENMAYSQTGTAEFPVCTPCNQDYPFYLGNTRNSLLKEIEKYKEFSEQATNEDMIAFFDGMVSSFESRIKVMDFLGVDKFNEMNDAAKVILEVDPNTDYGLYLELRGVVKGVIEDIRGEIAEEYEVITLPYIDIVKHIDNADDVKDINPNIQQMYDALKILVPERISEPGPN